MDGTLIEWDVGTWDELEGAIGAFEDGPGVYVRLLGPMKDERLNIYQALAFLVPSMKVTDVRGDDSRCDLLLFHPVDATGGGDESGEREPRRPPPSGHADAMSGDLSSD